VEGRKVRGGGFQKGEQMERSRVVKERHGKGKRE